LNGVPGRSRGGDRLEVVRAVDLLYALDERDIAVPILADMGSVPIWMACSRFVS
jgi:soluble lytic murein transglycosylase